MDVAFIEDGSIRRSDFETVQDYVVYTCITADDVRRDGYKLLMDSVDKLDEFIWLVEYFKFNANDMIAECSDAPPIAFCKPSPAYTAYVMNATDTLKYIGTFDLSPTQRGELITYFLWQEQLDLAKEHDRPDVCAAHINHNITRYSDNFQIVKWIYDRYGMTNNSNYTIIARKSIDNDNLRWVIQTNKTVDNDASLLNLACQANYVPSMELLADSCDYDNRDITTIVNFKIKNRHHMQYAMDASAAQWLINRFELIEGDFEPREGVIPSLGPLVKNMTL